MTHIQQRRDTAAQWASVNPVLFNGEIGWETDTRRGKLGDGTTAWNSLDYLNIDPPVLSVAGKTGAVSLVVGDVDGAAPLASPAFTGNPTAPTPAVGDDDTTVATTAFVKAQQYAPLANPALTGTPTAPTPGAADDSTKIATTAWVWDSFAPLASPALTGTPTAPTPDPADNDTSIATTAFVRSALMQHRGSGARLDNGAVAQPSQPLTLRMATGYVSAGTNSFGVISVAFPDGGFPNGVLYVGATTMTGTGVAPVVDSGAVSKASVSFAWPGVASTTISFTYIAIGF